MGYLCITSDMHETADPCNNKHFRTYPWLYIQRYTLPQKETQHFWSCRSFVEECRSVNFGPNVIARMKDVGYI